MITVLLMYNSLFALLNLNPSAILLFDYIFCIGTIFLIQIIGKIEHLNVASHPQVYPIFINNFFRPLFLQQFLFCPSQNLSICIRSRKKKHLHVWQ